MCKFVCVCVRACVRACMRARVCGVGVCMYACIMAVHNYGKEVFLCH